MATPEGELFFKPCTDTEIDFYQSAQFYPEFKEIMPLFMGTLDMENPAEVTTADDDIAAITTVVPEAIEKSTGPIPAAPEATNNVTWKPNKDRRIKSNRAVVLQNLTYGFKKPNILDAKLGVRLYADDAPLEKRRRFDTISRETTHSEYGCRIAGMRVYKGSENPDDLDEEGYRIYDRDYGRVVVRNDNFVDAVRKFVFNKAAGIDEALGKAVCGAFAEKLARVEEVLMAHQTRMYSSSILFVFEGDGAELEESIRKNNAIVDEHTAVGEEALAKVPVTSRFDSGIAMGGEYDEVQEPLVTLNGKVVEEEQEPSATTNGEDVDEEQEPSATMNGEGIEKEQKPLVVMNGEDFEEEQEPSVLNLKLIDCAHAKWTPGEGPDENTLTGVRSLRKIFEELSE